MSMEALRDFLVRVAEDEELRSEVPSRELPAVVAFAARCGYEFSQAELMRGLKALAAAGAGELREEELEAVSGGSPLAFPKVEISALTADGGWTALKFDRVLIGL